MSSRTSTKKKKESKICNKETNITKSKPTGLLQVETSVYEASTSMDISPRWDTTSSGSSYPGQLVLDGVLVASPLPFKSQSEVTEPKDLYQWALDRVSKYEKAISDKKNSENISFDFKLSSATEETTEKTDNLPTALGITDFTPETVATSRIVQDEVSLTLFLFIVCIFIPQKCTCISNIYSLSVGQ